MKKFFGMMGVLLFLLLVNPVAQPEAGTFITDTTLWFAYLGFYGVGYLRPAYH